MTHPGVSIQITPESMPAIPSWMGEVAAFAQVLTHTKILKKLQEQVRFARARFGTYELIDFVVVLIGYAVSSEPTLKAFYERLAPFAEPFMALFGRNQLPHRSTLSRFLAALNQPTLEALRTCFQEDLLVRKPFPASGGLFDRTGEQWLVIDVDGTRQATRQRALPQTDALFCSSSPIGPGVCAGLSREEAGRGGTYAYGCAPGAYAPASRHLRGSRQRGLSWGVTTSDQGDYELCNTAWAFPCLHPDAIRRPVWRRRAFA